MIPERLDPEVPPDRDEWWEETAHLWRYYWAADKPLPGGVIDAACGTGYGTAILHRAGHRVAGCDRDGDVIATARRVYGDYFFQCNIQQRDFAGYGTCVSFETLEHLPDPHGFLERLQPNVLLASTPIVPTRSYNPHHLHDFSREAFHTMLAYAGYKIMEEHLQSHPTRINVYSVVMAERR